MGRWREGGIGEWGREGWVNVGGSDGWSRIALVRGIVQAKVKT